MDWYRPSLEDVLKMSDGMIEHVLNGWVILDEPSTTTHLIILEHKPDLECCGTPPDGKEKRRERRILERLKHKKK